MMDGRVALLGLGAFGRQHLRVLNERRVLGLAFDPDPARLLLADAAFRADSLDQVFAAKAISAIVLATPAATHAELALRALEAGKDVFIEKPLALSFADGARVAATARRLGRIAMVGHLTLFHPGVERLFQLIGEGALGELRYAYSNRLNRGTVREEEDILWSFAPHDFAMLLRLFGRWPERVSAHGSQWLMGGRADLTVTHLEWDQGQRAHVFVSWLHPMKEHRFVVLGSKRMAVFTDGKEGGRLTLSGPVDPPEPGMPAELPEMTEVAFVWKEPLAAELDHFLEVCQSRATPKTSVDLGLDVVRLLEAARQSLLGQGAAIAIAKGPED